MLVCLCLLTWEHAVHIARLNYVYYILHVRMYAILPVYGWLGKSLLYCTSNRAIWYNKYMYIGHVRLKCVNVWHLTLNQNYECVCSANLSFLLHESKGSQASPFFMKGYEPAMMPPSFFSHLHAYGGHPRFFGEWNSEGPSGLSTTQLLMVWPFQYDMAKPKGTGKEALCC